MLKVSDNGGERMNQLRPSPAQIQSQNQHRRVLKDALADHGALFDNFFAGDLREHRGSMNGS